VPCIEAYVAHLLSKEAYNPAALEGQQQMKKGATWAAKCAHTKASATMVTTDQLDHECQDWFIKGQWCVLVDEDVRTPRTPKTSRERDM
jgi:hypothetical protein